ncbi:hypothetical protein ACLOJK_000993 [Asimina triloba]
MCQPMRVPDIIHRYTCKRLLDNGPRMLSSLSSFVHGMDSISSCSGRVTRWNSLQISNSKQPIPDCFAKENQFESSQKLAKSTKKAYAIQSQRLTKGPSKPKLKSIHLATSLPQFSSPSAQKPPPGSTDRHILRLCRAGYLEEAVVALESLARHGSKVDPKIYMFLLHCCIDWYSIETGRKLHALLDSVCDSDLFLQTKLVSMYAKCGSLEEARRMFARMSERSLITWSAMIGACARERRWAEILVLFAWMVGEGVAPDAFLLPKIIQACANSGNVEMGELAHSVAVRSGLDSSVYVRNAILAMYAKCGKLQSAKKMFEKMVERIPGTWNTMISVSCQSGENEDAMMLFNQMQAEGLRPDLVTWNTLISSYNQSGACDRAMELMEEMECSGVSPDVFTWTSMISGSAQNNRNHQAVDLFRGMLLAGTEPNNVTIASVVSACASLKDFKMGELIHSVAVKLRYGNDVLVGNSLISFYANCEMLEEAQRVFDEISEPDVCSWNAMIGGYMQAGYLGKAHNLFEEMRRSGIQRNVVTWNVMISGYIQNGDEDQAMELFHRMEMDGVKQSTASWNLLIAGYIQNRHINKALKIFRQMQCKNMRPNSITILSILPACENLLAASKVKEIHACILRSSLDCEVSVMNLLIFAYAKSGDIVSAKFVFDSLSFSQKDLITWNSMLSGYVLHGQSELAIEHINQMKQSGVKPNHAVVTNMISAYSLAGMVDEGKELFSSMTQDYQILPGLEHYAGIVDLFGRSGRLREAMDFIDSMPVEPNSVVWSTLLTACRIHRNISLAIKAAEHPIQLEPGLSVVNRLFLQIHVLGGRIEDASDVRKCRRAIKNKQRGPHDMQPWLEEEEEEEIVGIHSEKLAVAFALIGNPAFRSIRIIKNVRMCSALINMIAASGKMRELSVVGCKWIKTKALGTDHPFQVWLVKTWLKGFGFKPLLLECIPRNSSCILKLMDGVGNIWTMETEEWGGTAGEVVIRTGEVLRDDAGMNNLSPKA